MADLSTSGSSGVLSRLGSGPGLLGLGVGLFVLTRIVVWLPLGFVGTFINGFLWPVILGSVAIGGFLTWRRMKQSG